MKRLAGLWHSFWSWAWSASVTVKIMGMVAASMTAATLTLVVFEQQDDYAALRKQLQERGIAIGTGLAAQSRDLILTNSEFAIYSLVRRTLEAYDDLVYVFILDTAGNVVVHTFEGGFPIDLLGKNEVAAGEPYSVQRLQTEAEAIQDVAVPVLGGRAGVIRLGMSEASTNAVVAGQFRDTLLRVVPIMAVGLVVAYGLASIVFKPITELAEAAKGAGRGGVPTWRPPPWAKDEFGALGATFVEMTEELRTKEEQVLGKVIEAQEDERKRIARELHDETGQALTSLMIGLKLVEDSQADSRARDRLADLRALTSRTLGEVHRMATALRPSLLDDLGLADALRKHLVEYSDKTGISVDSHIGVSREDLRPRDEIAVFRIIQEALTNVAKYSKATSVSVVVQQRDSVLVAVVEDNGVGFDVNRVISSPNDKNIGLFGMYERAALVGGKLTVESGPGAGTTVFLEVPLKTKGVVPDGQDKVDRS